MRSNYWLLSTEAYQQRLVREIRLARTPVTARSREGASARPSPMTVAKGVATIRVEGVLTPTPDAESEMFGDPNTTYQEMQAALSAAAADPKVKEIVWSIDSPGGAVDGLFALLDDIADARASGVNMRVIADNAHSAAYGIAAAAGNITAASRTSSFGSVGVATSVFLSGGMCGEVVDVTSSDAPEKRPNPKTPEGREVLTRYLDQIAGEFMTSIAAGRGVTRDHVALNYGRGSSMLAGPAKDAGLIDGVASRADANGRTLTDAKSADTVRTAMHDEPAAPEAQTDVAPEAALPIPVDVDLSALTALSEAERAELAAFRAERAEREATERRSLVTALVELGAEVPATAWSNGAPTARLAAEPLTDLRARVTALRSTPRASAGHTPPPAGTGMGEEALEDFERADAAKIKDPDARARFVASRIARKQKAQ